MIGFEYPLWLVLLALIPLIRWLHRFRQQSITIPSTTLFLWRSIQIPAEKAGIADKPDPRWILRAFLSGLLILSLAQPFIPDKNGHSVEVWIDDSLSMFTLEQNGLRIRLAIQQLTSYLGENKPSQILVHSLANPDSLLMLDAQQPSAWNNQLNEWAAQPRGEPSPPPSAILSPNSTHILLTDAADKVLNRWSESAPLQHIIRVGSSSRNLALTRLSLRQPLPEAGHTGISASIENFADIAQKVRLTLSQQEQVLQSLEVNIGAHGRVVKSFTLAAGNWDSIQARIENSHDPLPLDDTLELEISSTDSTLRYKKQGDCGPYIQALLDSRAGFIATDKDPDMLIDCSLQSSISSLPTLRLHPVRSRKVTSEAAHSHAGLIMNSLQMPAGLPYSDDAPPISTNAIALLSADDRLLILQQPAEVLTIHSYLDTSDPLFARQLEYPLLMLELISRVSGQSLENLPQTVHRNPQASHIKPLPINPSTTFPFKHKKSVSQASLVSSLLLIALFLVLLDAMLASGLVDRLRNQHR